MGSLVTVLVTFAIVLAVFFIGRGLALWYWKVDEALGLLREVRDHLATIRKLETEGLRRRADGKAPE